MRIRLAQMAIISLISFASSPVLAADTTFRAPVHSAPHTKVQLPSLNGWLIAKPQIVGPTTIATR